MEHEFFMWIMERLDIQHNKLIGEPKPWTDDPIFQSYMFCNVFREQDKTTIWIRENIREKYADHPNLWFALCVARLINYPRTLDLLGDLVVDWNRDDAHLILDNISQSGEQIYSRAYTLATAGRKVPKNKHTVDVLNVLWRDRGTISLILDHKHTLEQTHLFIRGHYGISDFISYEIITDMRHTHYLENAPDIYTWASAGPGAIRGLNRTYGRELNTKIKPCQANKEMQYLLSRSEMWPHVPKLEMRDIEHSLCEFDKYERIKSGKSTVVRKYNGTGK